MGNDADPFTPLQAQMLTPIDCYKVWLYSSDFSRTQRLTPVELRQLDALLRNDVVYMTSLKVRSLSRSSPEHSLNPFAVIELLYRTMHQHPTSNKHTK